MANSLDALRASVNRLHELAGALDDAQLSSPSYCDDWTIAQVLSHLGSGAVIMRRGLQDAGAGAATPEDFNPSVWDEWNAKPPRAQADDALAADEALMEMLEGATDAERARLTLPMGPLRLSFDAVVGMRLNEHVLHTWDIAVALDDAAVLPSDAAACVVDNLSLIARFAGKSDGEEGTIAVRTTDPDRAILVRISEAGVELENGEAGRAHDLELPAEALSRAVYGRLDPDHTPAVSGDSASLDRLRTIFPGM
jgi:uncharacterized protein (TIGR03083 family)